MCPARKLSPSALATAVIPIICSRGLSSHLPFIYVANPSDGEDDLISFASDGPSRAATPTPLPAVGMGEAKSKPKPAPASDIFADLTNLARTWKPANIVPSPRMAPKPVFNSMVTPIRTLCTQLTFTTLVSHVRANGNHQAPTTRYQSLESFLAENSSHPTAPVQSAYGPPVRVESRLTNTNESLATGSTTMAEPEYDEGTMRRLEDIIAQVDAIDIEDTQDTERHKTSSPAQRLIEVDNPQPQPAIPTFNPPSTPPTYRFSRHINENEPIVRLTQAVYNSIMDQISRLQKDKTEALMKVSAIQRDLDQLGECDRDASSTVGKLRYQLESNKDYKAAMGREIRQKDIELYKMEMEIDSLKSKVVEFEALQLKLERLNGELNYLKTSMANEEDSHVSAIAQLTAAKDEETAELKAAKNEEIAAKETEIASLKAAVARNQAFVSDHATRAKNVGDTQAQREKKIKQLEDRLLEEQEICNNLRDEVELLRESRPSREQVESLQEELRARRSEIHRQKNEIKLLNKRCEFKDQAIIKKTNPKIGLRGAAHLVIPSSNTRLPKYVFPCIECFAKNIDCDHSSRCQNCARDDEKCARWRCGVLHATGDCNPFSCTFVHDANGWLMTRGPRPQWAEQELFYTKKEASYLYQNHSFPGSDGGNLKQRLMHK
ncbi:hypothetical protein K458DRAFT_460441 [Lentithecium fluviatile CBS 122367]|uniref:Uncharacterized protein n=1 Tax=Lentithecium fluviatile CBS 122367 TaxID=1168545 RepID=A0A6G1IPN4_9PLEO|nr:hypothetical protein K458DRAFT_460441 [Lentithecium fluviatile CBS 122367]